MAGTSNTNGKLPRRERERLMRRRDILEAARAVFAEKGYTHATLDEIAQRAEFGKGTLYNYFEGGKEDILFAIFDEIYEDICQLIHTAFSSAQDADHSFRKTFHDLVTTWITFFIERQDVFMIVVKEAYRMVFHDDPGKASYFQMHSQQIVDTLVPFLETAMERGEVKPLPPHAVAYMILGNLKGIQMHMCLQETETCSADSVLHSPEAAANFLTSMLCDGLVAPSEPYLTSIDASHTHKA